MLSCRTLFDFRGIAAVTFLFVSASVAVADDLTIGQCRDIYIALMSLDRFKLGDQRLTVALDIAALTPIWRASEVERIALASEAGGGKEIKPDTAELGVFMQSFQRVLGKACPVTLGRIKAAKLKLGDDEDQNAIPPTTLAALMPILDRCSCILAPTDVRAGGRIRSNALTEMMCAYTGFHADQARRHVG
jgi:hypothetical protein